MADALYALAHITSLITVFQTVPDIRYNLRQAYWISDITHDNLVPLIQNSLLDFTFFCTWQYLGNP